MNPSPLSSATRPTHDQISERARLLWRQRGEPLGQDEEIWLEAERQIDEELRGSASPQSSETSVSPVALGMAAEAGGTATLTPPKVAGARKRTAKAR